MSMKYIRDYYKVPAKRGARIAFGIEQESDLSKFIYGFLDAHTPEIIWHEGTIISAKEGYIRVRFDHDLKRVATLHPTWSVKYL